MSNNVLGISLTIISLLCFSTVFAFYKICEPFLSTSQTLCISNFCSFIVILPLVLTNGKNFLATKHFTLIALRTLLGLASAYCITRALITTPLSEVILLSNTSPLFIPFIVLLWHKTKIPHQLWTGLIIGFIGVFIVLQPGIEKISSGQIFGLISGISSALMLVIIREFAHETLLKIMFYYFLIISVLLSPSVFIAWPSIPLIIWFYLALAGIIMIGAQICLNIAMRYTSSHEIAPFLYTSVIFAGLIDWIIWHNEPGLITILGMLVVCIGGIITLVRTKQKTY